MSNAAEWSGPSGVAPRLHVEEMQWKFVEIEGEGPAMSLTGISNGSPGSSGGLLASLFPLSFSAVEI